MRPMTSRAFLLRQVWVYVAFAMLISAVLSTVLVLSQVTSEYDSQSRIAEAFLNTYRERLSHGDSMDLESNLRSFLTAVDSSHVTFKNNTTGREISFSNTVEANSRPCPQYKFVSSWQVLLTDCSKFKTSIYYGRFQDTPLATLSWINDVGVASLIQRIFFPAVSSIFSGILFSFLFTMFGFKRLFIDPIRSFRDLLTSQHGTDIIETDKMSHFIESINSVVELKNLFEAVQQRSVKLLEMQDNEVHLQRSAAVARTTQMLAHDVRRPFSTVKAVMELLRTAQASEIPDIVKNCIPEIESTLHSVNGMIEDVMQVGAEVKLYREPASFFSLLRSCLVELSRVYPDAQISFDFQESTNIGLMVDTRKVSRVFSNLVSNAYQAMNFKGHMWFSLHHVDENWVDVVIGNSGSYIAQEAIGSLFEAFFTSGKRDGTGLGLAIARRVVEAHGGSITCRSEKSESHPEGKVEFTLRLPLSRENPEATERLESDSQEIVRNQRLAFGLAGPATTGSKIDVPDGVNALEVETLLRSRQSPLCVIVLEDEAVYRNHLQALLEGFPSFAELIDLRVFAAPTEDFFCHVTQASLVILDVDLGKGWVNGLEVAKRLRTLEFRGEICIHSNRYPGLDFSETFEAGANAVFPKPMSSAHLLKLLRSVASNGSVSRKQVSPTKVYRVALVEDQLIVRLSWKKAFSASSRIELDTYESPESFLASCSIDEFDAIFTDYHFGRASTINGLEFAKVIREKNPTLPIFLTSNGDFWDSDIRHLFNHIMNKETPDEQKIISLILEKKSNKDELDR